MAEPCVSADVQRLLQLRVHVLHSSQSAQQLAKIADSQQAALMDTLDNLATLEKQNMQLRQSLLMSLQILTEKTGRDVVLKTTCAPKPLELPHGHRVLDQESEPCLDQAAETETTESNPSGSSGTPAWPDNATTVLISNMPPRSTIDELLRAFPPDGSYDLINLPFNVKARRTSSFATINFISVDLAEAFFERFDGQRLPHSTRSSKGPLRIVPAIVQGLEENLAVLRGGNGLAEMKNAALLPRLYLTGAVAERLASRVPRSIKQPHEPGQPRRLDFREVLTALDDGKV